jgi:predicted metal-binding membrane protein
LVGLKLASTPERALRRDRLLVALSLAGVVGLAWLYLWRAAMSMHGEHGASTAMAAMWPLELFLTFAMWVVMMAGMMLPSATPTVMVYASMVGKNAERGNVLPAAWIFASGYFLVWTLFSLFAALLQAALQHAGLLTDMMESVSSRLTGVLLLAAGLYQLTPVKDTCLGKCRDPVRFFMLHWRPGAAGALRMGITHGAYCVGCCWVLMLLLFAVGVMNLAWVAVVAAFVLLEKILPAGRLASRLAGVALIGVGVATLALTS